MALILDYDEDTLRRHMKERELSDTVLNKRVEEFKVKSLPAAKYFDDKYLLHLVRFLQLFKCNRNKNSQKFHKCPRRTVST